MAIIDILLGRKNVDGTDKIYTSAEAFTAVLIAAFGGMYIQKTWNVL